MGRQIKNVKGNWKLMGLSEDGERVFQNVFVPTQFKVFHRPLGYREGETKTIIAEKDGAKIILFRHKKEAGLVIATLQSQGYDVTERDMASGENSIFFGMSF